MHFECARVAQHPGKDLESRSADNGVFDHADALVLEHPFDGVELELYLLFAHVLCGVNKGAAHVVVTQEPDFETDAAGLRIAERRGCRAVGNGNHDIGIDGAFLRELLAHLAADLVAALFKDLGIRTAEVDVFENAVGEAVLVRKAFGMEPVVRDGQEFARLDVADVIRAEQVEGAGFAGYAPCLAHAGDRKRAEAESVAGDEHGVFADEHEAETAGKLGNGLLDGVAQGVGLGARDFVQEDFGVGRCLEDVTVGFHLGAEFVRVGDVAVVYDRDLAPLAAHQDRLRIGERARSRGAVAYVADACETLQFIDIVFAEERRYKPHGLADADLVSVSHREAGTFLAAVLQGIKAHGDISNNVIAIVDADNATFFVQFVEHNASLKCLLPLPRRSQPTRTGASREAAAGKYRKVMRESNTKKARF